MYCAQNGATFGFTKTLESRTGDSFFPNAYKGLEKHAGLLSFSHYNSVVLFLHCFVIYLK